MIKLQPIHELQPMNELTHPEEEYGQILVLWKEQYHVFHWIGFGWADTHHDYRADTVSMRNRCEGWRRLR